MENPEDLNKQEEEESSEEESESDEGESDDDDDDDNDFEFAKPAENAGADGRAGAAGDGGAEMVSDQHFDEALSVSEDEESVDDSVSMDNNQIQEAQQAAQQQLAKEEEESSEEESSDEGEDTDEESDEDVQQQAQMQQQQQQQQQLQQQQMQQQQNANMRAQQQQPQQAQQQQQGSDDDDDDDSSSSEETDSSSEEEEEDDDNKKKGGADTYNPQDYAHLNVSAKIQDLFDYIGRHKPADMPLETKLRPFIPDFIPAVGEIDSFLKIPPPDGSEDFLGLKVLDEPSANQSDPTVLDIKLRVTSKQSGLKPMAVRSIEHADKHPKRITTWINNIEEAHRIKQPPSVNYSKEMPDIEDLMQIWPTEFEELLKHTPLPSGEINMELQEYVKVICAILDIPVYDKLTESLHVLFTLYSEFKKNAHFQQL